MYGMSATAARKLQGMSRHQMEFGSSKTHGHSGGEWEDMFMRTLTTLVEASAECMRKYSESIPI